ncbi:hypothetical protein [Bradyrhizobium genosp. P]|uniref:hypothetical protein n=1 Tax=Bradyrhizobium genosp. P TaxID=83641 RepID=UPI003CF26B51
MLIVKDVVSGGDQLDSIHSNNLLAVELESENDVARRLRHQDILEIEFGWSGGFPRQQRNKE